MDEEGLATAWGSAVAEALDYAPDSYADDSARALDALVSSAQGEPGRNFSGTSTEDWEDAAGVATEAYGGSSGSFTNRQWATLAATHIPLLVLCMFAIVAALERVSVAARWLARSFRVSRSSTDSSVDDDDDDDADDDRARLVGPPGSEYQQHSGHAPPPVRRALPLQLPYVCVQLPMYDEAKVARRIIDSACLLRWPRDLLEIQILDDSDDERCRAIVDASAARWRERGLMCNVVRRSHRRGFKAGALEAGRKKTAADLIAVFDADCVPFPDYLERVVPHFYEPDGVTMVPDLAMVQARWGFLNHDDNVVTRAQAMGLEAHRAAASAVLSRSAGCCVRAGAGATWSARAVTAAGGWDATALLEGTDLALRAHCAGYVSRFLDRVVVMTELPGTFAAYKAQQERWARGWAQVTKRHAFPVAGAHGKPVATRLHLLAAVTRHAAWPVALVWALAFPVLVARGRGWSLYDGGMDRTAATAAYVAPFATLVAADVAAATTLSPAPPLRALRRSRVLAIRATWIVPHLVVQTGMVVHRALSFALGVVSPRIDFARTPKDGRGAAYVFAPPRGGEYDGDESARVGEGRTDAGAAAAETGGSRGGARRGGVAGAMQGAARLAEEEEMQSPTKRAGRGGHFDATAPWGRMPTIPGTPPRPELGGTDGGEVAVSMPDASGRASSSSPVGSSSSSGASSSRASSSPPESPELVAMWRTTFLTELVISAAMLRLAFAVAVVDGWREPALMCVGFAACVAFVAAHHGDDGWRASRRRSNMAGVESLRFAGAGGAEALLVPSARETYGGLDGASNAALGGRDGESLRFADGVRSGFGGGVYDHRARTRRPAPDPAGDRRNGGPDVRGGWGGEHESGFSRSAHETRSAIRQYKRYRAKDFDLDTISVRSGESDAYSARRSAAGGGRGGGRAGGGGANDGSEDWGADSYSEAGLSETVYSELSAAVFADAPPVLLSAAQLQQQYVGAGGSARGPESVARESTSEFAPEDADAGEAHGAREER